MTTSSLYRRIHPKSRFVKLTDESKSYAIIPHSIGVCKSRAKTTTEKQNPLFLLLDGWKWAGYR